MSMKKQSKKSLSKENIVPMNNTALNMPNNELPEVVDSTAQFLRRIAQVPLLTAAEEIELAKAMSEGNRAQRRSAANLTPAERAQREQVIALGKRARARLIEANLRLVVSIAKKYTGWGIPLLDLIQEGNAGLIHAADKFDYRRGFRFSTYATWWIRQSVTRAIADFGRTIRLPVHQWEKVRQMKKVSQELTQELERQPTVGELAEALDLPVPQVERLVTQSVTPISLDLPVGEDADATLGDLLPDESSLTPNEFAFRQVTREEVAKVLGTLPPREEQVLKLRYGLEDGQSRTLEEVGALLGKTRERARQIEASALRRLRHPSRSRKLRNMHSGE